MNQLKYLDSCISTLKEMLGHQHNELESDQQRALSEGIKKLKRVAKRKHLTYEEFYRVVSEVAEAIAKVL